MTLTVVWGLVLGLAGVALAVGVVAVVLATPDQRRTAAREALHVLVVVLRGLAVGIANVLLMIWVLVSWRRVTRNLGLAYPDRYKTVVKRTYGKDGTVTEREHPRIVYPRRVVWPDAYGVVLVVWTPIGVGRREWENATDHLANVWRCRRVQVEQRRPGRLSLRALRRDPLDIPLSVPLPDLPAVGSDLRPKIRGEDPR